MSDRPHLPVTRLAEDIDAATLVALLAQLTGETPTDLDIARDRLGALALWPGSVVWIALQGTQIVATCTLIVAPNLTRSGAPWALIENVVTDQGHRGQGYGQAVINATVSSAFASGCFKVMLATGSSDPATHGFYQRCSFIHTKAAYEIRKLPKRGQ